MSVNKPEVGLEELSYITTAMRGKLSQGIVVENFEDCLAQRLGVDASLVVAVSTGTAALHLAALIKKPKEVHIPATTFVATGNVFKWIGSKINIIDVDEKTWNGNSSSVSVDLLGNPIDCEPLIEDAAQALGSMKHGDGEPCGTLGDIGVFSFFENKLITTGGEGGAMVFRNQSEANKARLLRQQGKDFSMPYAQMMGYNYRMTEIQAAFGLAQLERIDLLIQKHRAAWHRYKTGLKKEFTFQTLEGISNCWLTVVLTPSKIARKKMEMMFKYYGFPYRRMFPPLTYYSWLDDGSEPKVAIDLYERGITLPCCDSKQVEIIIYHVNNEWGLLNDNI